MPTWANNPDYTLHATTTKPEDKTHKAVFEIFDNDQQSNENQSSKSKKPSQDPNIRF